MQSVQVAIALYLGLLRPILRTFKIDWRKPDSYRSEHSSAQVGQPLSAIEHREGDHVKVLVLKQPDSPPEVEERSLAALVPGHARIKIHAAALNRRDVWIMRGKYPGIRHPIVLGSDGCGTVESVEGGETSWVGRRVVFYPAFDWGKNPAVQSPEFTIGIPPLISHR